MDKKNVIGSLSNTRKRKPSKKLVDNIRKEAFRNAYPDQETVKQKEEAKENTAIEEKQVEKEEPEALVEEAKVNTQTNEDKVERLKAEDTTTTETEEAKQPKIEAKPTAKKSNRGRKKKITPDGPNEFTTLNCTQPTLNRAKISSALTNTPMYQFVDEAIDHYIKYLKKSGKISLDF